MSLEVAEHSHAPMLPPVFATGRFPLLAQPSPGIKILQGVNSNLLAEHYWRPRVLLAGVPAGQRLEDQVDNIATEV